jgi:hypothetical protein
LRLTGKPIPGHGSTGNIFAVSSKPDSNQVLGNGIARGVIFLLHEFSCGITGDFGGCSIEAGQICSITTKSTG